MSMKFVSLLREAEQVLEAEMTETRVATLEDLSREIFAIRNHFVTFIDFIDKLLVRLSDMAEQRHDCRNPFENDTNL